MAVKSVASTELKKIRQQVELEEITDDSKNGFTYSGVDSRGVPVKGGIAPFDTAEEARFRLDAAGITVESLKPVSSWRRKRDKRPSLIEMAQLADNLAANLDIGLTPNKACQILARVHPNLAMKRALYDVAYRVSGGQPPVEAFSAQVDKKGKPFFPRTFVDAFRIAEATGALPNPEKNDESTLSTVVMLQFFAQAQRRAHEIFKQLIAGLIYPVGIISMVIVAFFIEVYWLVPLFADFFISLLQGKDSSLPLPTQIMLDISNFFRSPLGWGVSLLFFVSLGFSIYYFFFNEKGIDTRERLFLRLPIFKKFFIPYYASVFFRNLSMMWASEPSMTERFKKVAETSTNPVFREMSEHFGNLVESGVSIDRIFNGHLHLLGESFPPVAETVEQNPGKGQRLLYNYAKYLEQEAEEKMAWAIATLKQGAFFLAAGMVIFLLLAAYSPLLSLVGRLAGK